VNEHISGTWYLVMNDMVNGRYVKPSCSNVCRQENGIYGGLEPAIFELDKSMRRTVGDENTYQGF